MERCRWQTLEDEAPRDTPDVWSLLHDVWRPGYVDDVELAVQVMHVVPVRDPKTYGVSPIHLVIRANRDTDAVTAACEWYVLGR